MAIQGQVVVASKSIFQSRTLYANVLGPVFLWLGTKYGLQVDAGTQGAVITIVMSLANLVLRRLTTQPVHIVTPQVVAVPKG
jgi:hypothetical protein